MRVLGIPARSAALLGAAALAAGGALTAGPAYATPADAHSGGTGKATAVAARADLDVSVKGVGEIPVKASLSDVSAPADAEQKLLTAEVKGANNGRPVTLVKAEVAHASAQANTQRSIGDVKLVGVKAYAPGLSATPLLSAGLLKATASCETGKKPSAKTALADLSVLGKPVTVNGTGATQVEVPGVGTVDLALEETATTNSTATATALRLTYTVKPAKLDVVKASGEIVLAEATCAMPDSSGSTDGGSTDGGSANGGSTNGGSTSGGSDGGSTEGSSGGSAGSNGAEDGGSADNQPTTQTGDLAETGSSSATPIIAGVGAALLLAGGAMYVIRRRSSSAQDS
ncbi:SCO1860 family LAETG-anchored protein [Streptomyces gobiensis]|uniref:SCO1860 family LAETG-anchored protein n=1 Tax=Streptomyces gobiensis TaxID=2875706 RepID=UPI001E51DF06|nr:SCO1860 family LAETG-anchored protein [Streptomyces gobiensis]UGY92409.1 LPXTG cell wall anchor domain-containing protein [Streptomyces gobiensis]